MATTTPAPTKLNFDNIQGDVLEGLAKRVQTFLFFNITDPFQFRQRMATIIPLITTTTQALQDQADIDAHKKSGKGGLIKIVGTNIAFSQKGLTVLDITDDMGDPLFAAGQLADAQKSFANGGIADPGTVIGTGTTAKTDVTWDKAFKSHVHGVFLITGESQATMHERLLKIEEIFQGTIKVHHKVHGAVRPGAENGHEHFGFQDGLSQPAVIGFRQPNKGEAPTHSGVILFGEDPDADDTAAGDPAFETHPSWAKDSSFMVFRKLRQLVPEFNNFVAQNPIKDQGLSPAQGSDLLGARMVGRWKSGAPIELFPTQDNPAAAKDPNVVNDFDYSNDPAQVKCPFTAHLRKMNPRASAVPTLPQVQFRRIVRQGIPYGPEVEPAEAQSGVTKIDRGLLFVCYQSNIQNGFHFLQRLWANNANFPNANDGFDPIIGQQIDDPRTVTGMDPANVTSSLALPPAFVTPLGGEYFLSPSISALKTKFVGGGVLEQQG